MDREKIKETITRAIIRRNATTAPEREVIYSATRSALAKAGRADEVGVLEDIIRSVEDTFATPELPAAVKHVRRFGSFMVGAIAGAVAGGLFAWTLITYSTPNITETAAQAMSNAYAATSPQVPVATGFLHKVTDVVINMQETDKAKLLSLASADYVQLIKLDPQLAKQMPATLPAGSDVLVRANATDFKILLNWPLCGTVKFSNPELVDPVRDLKGTIGCPYFGYWTTGAADW